MITLVETQIAASIVHTVDTPVLIRSLLVGTASLRTLLHSYQVLTLLTHFFNPHDSL